MATDPAEAIRDFDWEGNLPKLAARARRYLRFYGWQPTSGSQPSRLSVDEVISEALRRVLDGNRGWIAGQDGDMVLLLSKTMKSVVMDEARKALREVPTADPPADQTVQGPDADENGEDAPIVKLAKEAAQGDEDCEMFLLAVEDEHTKREDIAAALEWSVDRVSAVRKKLQRRMNKLAERAQSERATDE